MPTFSIIVPAYNAAATISRTIDSVLAQIFSDFELIVIDDGSIDDTLQIVKGYTDPRIRVESQCNSGGPATPRNRGIDLALAELLVFLDADDEMCTNKLQRIYSAVNSHPNVAVYAHDVIVTNHLKNTQRNMVCGPVTEDFYRTLLLGGNRLSNSGTIVRKSFLDRYHLRFDTNNSIASVEDFDLWLRIAFHGGDFLFIGECLAVYSSDGTGISSEIEKHSSAHLYLLRKHIFSIQEFDARISRLSRFALVSNSILRTMHFIRNKRLTRAILASRALIFNPLIAIECLLIKGRKR